MFSLLSEEFLASVRLACVFGASGNEAVVVDREGEVFALGSNNNGCLGVGDSWSSLQPRRVESLCKKGTIVRTLSSVHTMSCTLYIHVPK